MSKFNSKIVGADIENLTSKYKWKLVRQHDGLTKTANDIVWIEWDEDGFFKDKYNDIAVGRSLVMNAFFPVFTWQTTEVTEIIQNNGGYIKFKTKNSTYELFELNN